MFGQEEEEEEESQTPQEPPILSKRISVRHMEGVGGGRGVFAEVDIPPGTLILAERPLCHWPPGSSLSDPFVLAQCIEQIFTSPVLHEVSLFLHPNHLREADSEEIKKLETYLIDVTNELKDLCPTLTLDELIRIALVLQHNGFESGLYKYLSLVNHSCIPNCIKFSPSQMNLNNWKYVSEIWSTQLIRAGEEITICYVDKIEIPYRTMKAYLSEHHRFKCECLRCQSSAVQDLQFQQKDREKSLEDLESIVETLERHGLSFDPDKFPLESVGTDHYSLFLGNDLKSFSDRNDLFSQTLQLIHYIHILLQMISDCGDKSSIGQNQDQLYLASRSHQMVVSLSVKIIESYSGVILEPALASNFASICKLYLSHSHSLYTLQCQYLPNFHPLLGETLSHLTQAIQIILNLHEKQDIFMYLFSLNQIEYHWAKTLATVRSECKKWETLSKQIHELYQISYEMLQTQLRQQALTFS